MIHIEVLVDDNVGGQLNAWFGDVNAPHGAIHQAVRIAAEIGRCDRGEVGCRLTNDAAIREINQKFLQHDYPTDVISFPYACEPPLIQGELVVSVETAATQASEYESPPLRELLLYVVHGTLHLVGFDDQNAEAREKMRAAEDAAMTAILAGGWTR